VVDGDAGVLFFFLVLQLGLHAAEQARGALGLFAQDRLGTGRQAVVQGVAQMAGGVLLHVARHGAEHGLHECQGRRVAGVILVGQACADGLHQQVGWSWGSPLAMVFQVFRLVQAVIVAVECVAIWGEDCTKRHCSLDFSPLVFSLCRRAGWTK